MLLAAIADPDPVMIFEHKLLYKTKGPVPEGYYTVPLDKAEVRRQGRDLTIVASGIMVRQGARTRRRSWRTTASKPR